MQDIDGRAGGAGECADLGLGKHEVLEHAFGEEEAVGVQRGGVGADLVVEAGAHLRQVGADGTPVEGLEAAGAPCVGFAGVVVAQRDSRFVEVQIHLFCLETQDLHVERRSRLQRLQAQQCTLAAHLLHAVQPSPGV